MKSRLQRERARQQPEPWPVTPFAVVGGLVRDGLLGEDFRRCCDALTATDPEALLPDGEPRPKSRWQPPLFPLLSPEAFRLAQDLVEKLHNPYLPDARDADEVCLSLPLYRRRPDLPPEVLTRLHFATLLALESLRAEVRELEPRRAWEEMETGHAVRLAAAWRRVARLEARLAAMALPVGVTP